MIVFSQMEANYPRLQDDDLAAHLAALSEITQDETADPVARLAAIRRQQLYFLWQSQMSQQAIPLAGAQAQAVGEGPSKTLDPRQVIASTMREAEGGR